MTQILFIVGVIVFFMTVYGVVMVGSLLLEGLQDDEPVSNAPSTNTRDADVVAVTAPS